MHQEPMLPTLPVRFRSHPENLLALKAHDITLVYHCLTRFADHHSSRCIEGNSVVTTGKNS